MRWFRRWYGANPLHLLAMIGCVMLAAYAAGALLLVKPVGVLIWFAGAVVGHDLILFPLYVIADRSVLTVFRHRPPRLPTVPWINYLRVPVVLSGLLLMIWFPLIFRIPSHFPRTTDLTLNPYLGHWIAVTGVLFLLSAVAFALRLRPGRRGRDTVDPRRDTADPRRDTADPRRDTADPRRTTGSQVYAQQPPGRETELIAGARDLSLLRARDEGRPPWELGQ